MNQLDADLLGDVEDAIVSVELAVDDASDATVETVTAQIKEYPGSTSWYRLDASTSIDQLKVTARALFDVSLSPPRA